jgi:hypothetical protein
MNEEEEDKKVNEWVMWLLHIFFLIAFFPALAITIPAHIALRAKGMLK